MITDAQFAALSEFRSRLNAFLRFTESASGAAGISAVQYQLLVHVRAAGPAGIGIGELAQKLGTTHQAGVALVKRCEQRGLVRKRRRRDDERRVDVQLAPGARRLVERLAAEHLRQLDGLEDVVRALRRARG